MNRQDMTQIETSTLPLFEQIRRPNKGSQSIVALIIGFFLCTFYAPSAMAIKEEIEQEQQQKALNKKTADQRYSKYLVEMKGKFKEAERLYDEQDDSLIGKITDIKNAIQNGGSIFRDDDRWKEALRQALELKAKADELHQGVVTDFEKDAELFKDTKLPKSFLKQHSNDVALLKDRYQQFNEQVASVTKTTDEDQKIEALKSLNELLGKWQFGRKHQYADKEQLGNFTPTSAKGKPLMLELSDAWEAGIESNPHVMLAALGDFDFSTLPSATDPAYLAETDEIVLTQAIRDKAKELEYRPVEIYYWVRNNIEFVPGWGAYQSAELTLEAKRGNAMDIASLHIALLRASKIPARYALGVADIAAERYTNWMGNFKNADVASDYASMNGIPTQVVTSGGKIKTVRTQHVWVEAAIDYSPSRGAKNYEADKWLPLDASFKQYDYQQGLDAVDIAGIDSQAVANQFINSGTVNESEGFIQNLDPAQLLATQQMAQDKLQDHIDNELTDPTVGDVIGGRRIKEKNYPTLSGSLPYHMSAQIATFGKLPEALQHRVGLGFGNNLTVMPMAKLNNQKITLSFKPATAADEQALEALLPDGQITDINQLPSFIPSSISVIPELAFNGEVFKTGNALRIGNEVDMTYQVYSPVASYAPYKYSVIAGSYLNIPVMAQTIGPRHYAEVIANLQDTLAKLENQDFSSNFTKDDLVGDKYYLGSLSYFLQYTAQSSMAALQNNGNHKFEIGYGSYGYEPNQSVFFGVPRGVNTGGASMNIRIGRNVQSFDGVKESRNDLRFQAGLISSALEHTIPEQMFSDPNDPNDNAVSAIKALQLASQRGQRIYQIDKNNVNTVLATINLDDSVEREIRSSISQGRIAISHANNINESGWSGSGYLILDPEIMDGSYKISGGKNGSDYISPALGVIDGFFGVLLEDAKVKAFGDTKFIKLAKRILAASAVGALMLFFTSVYNTVLDDDIHPVLKPVFIAVDIAAAAGASYLTAGLIAGITGGIAGAVVAGVGALGIVLVSAFLVNRLKKVLSDIIAINLINTLRYKLFKEIA